MRLQERATRFFCVTVSAFLGLALCLVGCGGDNPVNAPSIEAIAGQIVDVGGQVKVEVILIDADSEDIYALRVSSDHTGVALASLNGAILTLTGVAVGTATITVSATDASGQHNNEVTFEVTVVKPVAPTVAHEREALVALYEATDGRNWTMNTNWLTDHGLAWHGVRVIDGHVTELDLRQTVCRVSYRTPWAICPTSSTCILGEIIYRVGFQTLWAIYLTLRHLRSFFQCSVG